MSCTGTDHSTIQYLSKEEESIVLKIKEDSHVTQKQLAEELGYSISNVKYHMDKLLKKDVLAREGTNRKGKWIVK